MEKIKSVGKKIAALALILIFMAAPSWALDKVAILNFRINAPESYAYLKDAIPDMIHSRLNISEKKIIKSDKPEDAFKSGFGYALYGSFTKIGNAISLDTRLEDKDGNLKTFFSSKDSDSKLIEAIDELVSQLTQGKEVKEAKPIEKSQDRFIRDKVFNLNHPVYSMVLVDTDGDGKKEIVLASRNEVFIYDEELKAKLFEQKFSASVLTLNSADLNLNLKEEIYITLIQKEEPHTICLEFDGKGYSKLFEMPVYVNVIFEDGKPKLIAQSSGFNSPFDEKIFEIFFDGKDFVKGERLNIFIRENLNIYQIAPVKYKDKRAYIYIDEHDVYRILDEKGNLLGKLNDRYGGSQKGVEKGVSFDTGAKFISLPSRVITEGEDIFTLKNEGSRLFLRSKSFSKGKLVKISPDELGLKEVRESEVFSGYLSDLAFDKTKNYAYISIVTEDKKGIVVRLK